MSSGSLFCDKRDFFVLFVHAASKQIPRQTWTMPNVYTLHRRVILQHSYVLSHKHELIRKSTIMCSVNEVNPLNDQNLWGCRPQSISIASSTNNPHRMYWNCWTNLCGTRDNFYNSPLNKSAFSYEEVFNINHVSSHHPRLVNLQIAWPHGMCYSHYGNGVRNGAIFIAQWGLLSDCYKVNPIGQWGKIVVIVMGFVDTLELCPYVISNPI